MARVTVSMSDATAKELRRVVKDAYGNKKGALSSLVEGAVREALARQATREKASFRAVRDGKVLATSDDLQGLADILRQKGLDPRGMRIVSTIPPSPMARMGGRSRAG